MQDGRKKQLDIKIVAAKLVEQETTLVLPAVILIKIVELVIHINWLLHTFCNLKLIIS